MAVERAITPRWEWRTFGERFPDAEAQVAALPGTMKSSAETYLLCLTPGVNAKIRGTEIDVKRLHGVDRGLELWSPVFKASFPLDRADVTAVCGEWALTPPPLMRESYTRDQFMTEVIAGVSAIAPVDITKARRQVTIGGCSVEVSMVTLGAQHIQTVAVESENPEWIEPVVRGLGLSGVGNENYVVALRRLSGLPRTADDRAQEGATS